MANHTSGRGRAAEPFIAAGFGDMKQRIERRLPGRLSRVGGRLVASSCSLCGCRDERNVLNTLVIGPDDDGAAGRSEIRTVG